MKNKIARYIMILCLCMVSCVSRSGHLKDIDAIMETNPALALAELEEMDPAEMSTADHPYYALLYTQAQIKNGVIVTSDSLMRHAYEAYRDSYSKDLRRRAHFYNAQIAYDSGEYRQAMSDVVVAYDIAKGENDPYWIAKTAEMIGDIYFEVFNYQQAELYKIECVENYKKAGRTANHHYALSDLATVCLNDDRDQEAIAILDSLRAAIKAEEPFDSVLYNYMMVPLCAALLSTNQLDSLERLMPERYDLQGSEAAFDHAYTKSNLLSEDEGRKLLWEAYKLSPDEKHRARVLFATYERALNSGDYQYAAEAADSLLIMQGEISRELLMESVAGVQRDYYSAKSHIEAQRSQTILYALIAVAAAAIFIVILLLRMHRLRMKARNADLEDKIATLAAMKERLSESLSEKSSIMESLFKDRWSALNILCGEYFKSGSDDGANISLLARIEKELEKVRTGKSLKEIEAAVDANMGNIMSMLRKECPSLTEDNFLFLSLVYAGLSPKAVCLITGIKYHNFYLKKSRLSKRIASSAAPHKDLFIEKMGYHGVMPPS